ncbi:MAG: putative LPS assembly protein LptD [Prevotella sp.]
MRFKSVITLLLFAFIFVLADIQRPGSYINPRMPQSDTTVVDNSSMGQQKKGILNPDSTTLDSLQLAILKHNRAIDDSIRQDSLNKTKSKGINAPINYTAEDSLIYNAQDKTAHLFGSSTVKYEAMDLKSEKIFLNMDSNVVHATGAIKDTISKKLVGTPEFNMGKDAYKSDTMAYNFKTKKGLINQVFTKQQEGFLRSELSKRDSSGVIYLQHGRYTTCDKDCPDFYISLSRAKVRPGKDVVFGPAYLVVADVPLPLAIPYGFFPFTKSYSSGVIMPSYGDEMSRGFYLRDGGYYFAIDDKVDLKLVGEIYTKGSWGISAASNYNKRYRYSGSFLFSYQDTKNGDKGLPDYSEQKSFKVQWSHRQDPKANPFSSLSASVNFVSSSFERNNLTSMYNPQAMTQSTRTSSVSWSTTLSSIGMSLSSSANLSQNMRDSSIAMTLPDLNINISRFYPFKRKKLAGDERWYEKISMSYTGRFSNSITTKESKLLQSNLIKDWKNGFEHNIPINANFTLFDYLNVNPSFNFTDRMYSSKVAKSWDDARQIVKTDTTYGFHNVYNWSLSLGMSTKLYGFWTPSKKIFGDKIQTIRHVLTPSVSFSYAPDFGAQRYGYYDYYQKTDADGNVSLVGYSPYENGMFSVPGRGKSGNISFDLGNNLEMKIKSDKDSTGFRKLSLIDELGMQMSYNMAAKEKPLSDLNMRLRLKWWKNYTFNLNAVFATYAYELDSNGKPYVGNHTEWGYGRFGRFQGMSQNISYTLTPEKITKFFSGSDSEDEKKKKNGGDVEGIDTDIESNVDDVMVQGQRGAGKSAEGGKAVTDADGYMKFSIPWSLTFGYGITMSENRQGKFNTISMRYPYKFTQTLNVSGNVKISDGWNISFSSGYDFENHAMSMTTASLQRDLHCFNMSCSVVLAPYTSYNFTFRANAATLTDVLKYDKRSGYSNAVQWY